MKQILLGVWLVAAMGCGGTTFDKSCVASTPWLEVINQLTTSVDAAWDGGNQIPVPPNSRRFIDPAGIPAHPPYHLVVRDHQSGALVAELTVTILSGPEAMTLSEHGSSAGPTTTTSAWGNC